MNSLSLFIYAAETLSKLGVVFGVGAVLCLLWWGTQSLLHLTDRSAYRRDLHLGASRWPLAFGIALLVLAVVTPSRNTIYAIAASEFGEELAKTETANKAARALEAWIDYQLEKER